MISKVCEHTLVLSVFSTYHFIGSVDLWRQTRQQQKTQYGLICVVVRRAFYLTVDFFSKEYTSLLSPFEKLHTIYWRSCMTTHHHVSNADSQNPTLPSSRDHTTYVVTKCQLLCWIHLLTGKTAENNGSSWSPSHDQMMM